MDDGFLERGFLLVGEQIPLQNARYYFHEVTPRMMNLPGFSQSIRREFIRALNNEWHKEKHLAFAAFSDSHFVLLTSYFEFSPCDLSDYELMQILALCEADMVTCYGVPCEVDLDRLHKFRFKLA